MIELLKAVKDSLLSKNYYAALFIVLTLPDICGKIQFPSECSSKRYIIWFNIYLKDLYKGTIFPETPFLTGEDMYALRCSLLHEGSDIISSQKIKQILDNFILIETGPHLNYFSLDTERKLQISIYDFCTEVSEAVNKWINDYKDKQSYIDYQDKFAKINKSGIIMHGVKLGNDES